MRDVTLGVAEPGSGAALYDLMTSDETWTRYNGPYFGYQRPTLDDFMERRFKRLLAGDDAQIIFLEGRPVGEVSFCWECEATRWLEAGIVIYDSSVWGKGIGVRALSLWITNLFDRFDVERIGLTTWSGNPGMMACAEKLGFSLEGRLRKVRYYQGEYYDSVRYGVLRSEWSQVDTSGPASSEPFTSDRSERELRETVQRMERRLGEAFAKKSQGFFDCYREMAGRFERDLGRNSRDVWLAKASALMLLQSLRGNEQA